MFVYCFNNPVNTSDDSGNWPKWLSGALNIVSGTLQAAAGAVIGAAAGWTGVGAVAAAFLVVNGAATVTQGIGQIVNTVTQSTSMREDNIIRTGVQSVGRVIGGDVGATAAGIAYDATVVAASLYTPSVNTPTTSPTTAISGACFIAGTLVLTENGYVPIEKIQLSDMVFSENPDSGEKSLKAVVQVFVSETNELIHVRINNETILATPEHPFFIHKRGWVSADKLQCGDLVVLQSGKTAPIIDVYLETAQSPILVYNFEVADFHTYYVGNNGVLVHNDCRPTSPVKVNENGLNGIDVHAFKKEFVGKNVSRWDIFKDTANKSILWLGNKTQTAWKETGYFLEELIEFFPKKG